MCPGGVVASDVVVCAVIILRPSVRGEGFARRGAAQYVPLHYVSFFFQIKQHRQTTANQTQQHACETLNIGIKEVNIHSFLCLGFRGRSQCYIPTLPVHTASHYYLKNLHQRYIICHIYIWLNSVVEINFLYSPTRISFSYCFKVVLLYLICAHTDVISITTLTLFKLNIIMIISKFILCHSNSWNSKTFAYDAFSGFFII